MNNVLTYEQLKQRLDAREREVMALVAENSALKKSEIEFNEYCRSECENEGSEWVDDFTETPATSAALAEVEANTTEKALDGIIEFIDRDSGLGKMKTQYDLSSAIVEYVQKLREGRV